MHTAPGLALSIPSTPSRDHARVQRVSSVVPRATCGCLLARRRRSVDKGCLLFLTKSPSWVRGLLFEVSSTRCGVRVEHEQVASGSLSWAETLLALFCLCLGPNVIPAPGSLAQVNGIDTSLISLNVTSLISCIKRLDFTFSSSVLYYT